MEISATFSSEPEDIIRGQRAAHRAGNIVMWGMAAAACTMAVVAGSPLTVLFVGVVLLLQELSLRRHVKRRHPGRDTFTVTMTDEEYRIKCSSHEAVRPWTGFKRVKRIGDFWILRAAPAGAMTLPASALDPAQTAAFMDLMRAKGLMPPVDLPPA